MRHLSLFILIISLFFSSCVSIGLIGGREIVLAQPEWQYIDSATAYRRSLGQGQVVVMFSATWCVNCHAAAEWWEDQTAPAETVFIFWESKQTNYDSSPDQNFNREFNHVAAKLKSAERGTLPLCAIFENKKLVWTGCSYTGCTKLLKEHLFQSK